MSVPANSILLVLDDEPVIVRLIIRSFGDEFDKILYASTPEQAESLLNENRVTHFVCDSNLGPGQPPGIELINRWYTAYPNIQKAILFTGMPIDADAMAQGIQIISKGDSPQILLNHLKGNTVPPDIYLRN